MDQKTKASILVVDDEESIREFLQIMLKRDNYHVESVDNGEEALKLIDKKNYTIVITDIAMPGMSGIDLLTKIRQRDYETAVIVMTAHGSTESAVEAMKLGASDYLTKPFQIDEMKLAIEGTLKSIQLTKENRQLRSELKKTFSFDNIIGTSAAMSAVFDMIERVSQTKTNILILGESGTGKELVAHAIHHNSPIKDSPFVVINCGAIPENLLESELFGHKRGSFTGAVTDKKGLFQMADKGTLFLDEVGELPLNLQVKLLRVLQSKSFRSVGGTEDIQVDTRIIAATNRNLEEAVKEGAFREDLFYRLNVIQIHLPSLRERKEDIPALANYFLKKFNLSMGKAIKTISQEALQILMKYSYPGNIRELENIIERAVALEAKTSIFPESMPAHLLQNSQENPQKKINSITSGILAEHAQENSEALSDFDLEKKVEEFEKKYILQALEKSDGVKKRAAELLGISFRSLRYRIEKYGIQDPNPEEAE